jgi:hypothetical protein
MLASRGRELKKRLSDSELQWKKGKFNLFLPTKVKSPNKKTKTRVGNNFTHIAINDTPARTSHLTSCYTTLDFP